MVSSGFCDILELYHSQPLASTDNTYLDSELIIAAGVIFRMRNAKCKTKSPKQAKPITIQANRSAILANRSVRCTRVSLKSTPVNGFCLFLRFCFCVQRSANYPYRDNCEFHKRNIEDEEKG